MRLTRKYLQSVSVISDSSMSYGLYDLDDDPNVLNTKVLRWMRNGLLTFLCIVLAGAVAILGIGIWTLEAPYGTKQVSELIGADLYKVDSYLLIIGGGMIIIITIIGFCGVLKNYRCMLGLHLGLLAFMSVMLFVAGVLGYVLVAELEDKVRDRMENAVIETYGLEGSRGVTSAWDKVQREFKCCGVRGGLESEFSWYIYQRSEWFESGKSYGKLVPDSCCHTQVNLDQCTGLVNGTDNSPPSSKPPVSGDPTTWGYTLYTQGCFDALDPYMRRTGITIGTTAIVVGIFMLVELVLSICIYRTLPERT